jgi:BirA family biotin operon repressor/biotin-[acetyl-CoA-carboxylase] ligase
LELEIYTVKKKGYQIPHGLELLDSNKISNYLNSDINPNRIRVFSEVNSTNDIIFDSLKLGHKELIVLAEYQSAGKGRRGRKWFSPFGTNIYLSIHHQFHKDPSELSGLSLAAGVAIVKALTKYGVAGLELKWPNDVLWQNRKLSGSLIEMTAESHALTNVVIGIGINCRIQKKTVEEHNEWIDLHEILGSVPERNRITAIVINELIKSISDFEKYGFLYFKDEWQKLHAFQQQKIVVQTHSENFAGRVVGINDYGELLVIDETNQTRELMQGEISIRLL